MSRHLIAYEGRDSKDGRRIAPGALQWDPEKSLPIVTDWMSESGEYKIGRTGAHIIHIERIDNELWADIWPEGIVDAGHCLSLDLADSDIEMGDGNILIFNRGKIIGAHLLPIELWMWDSK